MKYILLSIGFILGFCIKPKLQSVPYQEALEDCLYKKEKIQEKYPNNALISVPPDCLYGVQLPILEMTDMDGNQLTTESLMGKKNIINFWFTTCPPCLKEMPWLNKIKEDLGDETINYIAICRDSREEVEEFLLKKEFNFAIVPNGKDLIEKQFGLLWGYPFTIVTDKYLIITHISRIQSTEEDFRNEMIPHLTRI